MTNKQKAWRRAAADAKRSAVAAGSHVKGARYGKIIRNFTRQMANLKAKPSDLFMNLARHAGIISKEAQ